jgi:hypothetical protein
VTCLNPVRDVVSNEEERRGDGDNYDEELHNLRSLLNIIMIIK